MLHRADKARSCASCAGGGAAVAPSATVENLCLHSGQVTGIQSLTGHHSYLADLDYPAYLACIFECRIFMGKKINARFFETILPYFSDSK